MRHMYRITLQSKAILSGFGLFVVLILFSGCNQNLEPNVLYRCDDGRMVADEDECIVVIDEENLTVQLPVVNATQNEPPSDSGSAENILVDVQRNFSTLRTTRPEENESNETGTLYLDLNGWSVQEIVYGLAEYNSDFVGAFSAQVRYEDRDRERYYLGSGIKKIDDPFWITRFNYYSGVKEYKVNNLRINEILRPYTFYDMVVGKHDDSKFKLLYPDEWAVWYSIKCEKIESCRSIEAIKCTRDEHTLYVWTHNTPGEGYTEDIRYTMSAMDDGGETFETFEEFYCTPI